MKGSWARSGRRVNVRALGTVMSGTNWALALAGAAWIAGCGADEPLFNTGGGGTTTTTTTATGGGGTGGGGNGGTGGDGGTGAGFTSCDACPPDAPLCVDEMACAAACPDGRDLCHPAGAPEVGACCAIGEQCCEAQVFGYTGGDLCRPDGAACPLGCPDSDVACPLQQYCELDGATGTYACKESCPAGQVCGFNLCCPVGSLCVDGGCALPDLTIDAETMQTSVNIEVVNFAPDACELVEGCVGGPGPRTLMRFTLRTPNIGQGDLHLGVPDGNDLFAYSQCHNHFHFTSYADYRLRDANGNDVAFGHKQAFCLEDVQPDTAPPGSQAKYTCGFQGIQAGWADVYGGYLPCQWVDITDVPPGEYTLHAAVNVESILGESNYANNSADVTVTVPPNTCPDGCIPVDAACCKPDDPCGWAQNGSCDCGNLFAWDAAACSQCVPSSPLCFVESSCAAGCSPNTGPCCADGDPCGLANNFSCDCEAAFGWDDADCGTCQNPEPPCPVNSCPNGCTPSGFSPQCCVDGNPCGWDADGFCDCGGDFAWDSQDCSHCTNPNPACP